ncbi:serine/threonine protein kinase [Rhodothermaceae bacterium RA]|nr:serine/threonine protein kinase [Rhodothermaceae bacterium RA]
MDAAYWERVQALFEAALEHEEDERAAFLEAACGEDATLRWDVWSLLEADARAHTLLDGVALDAVDVEEMLSRVGQLVGPYRLLRQIGQGGMGAVYLAERADGQFEQRVALKLIKRGMDSEQILRRFAAERQILARLEHPHIARLLDGGLTDDGRPYFAMEYVEGEPIDVYCDTRRLSIDERLALFGTVCKAVLYAHARLVVHRDLKPDNILVAEDETGRPMVKLLDFGIARLLEDDREGLTQTGMAVMTPAYASPEQMRGEAVSTASDLYSLGVVLYELLTGVRPYELDTRNPAAALRVIEDTDPVRPSTVVSRTTAADDRICRARRLPPDRLRRRLSGDLDVICLKALRKEPERRYDSVAALQDDLQRHLDGLPVSARPDTPGYRLRKFASRHHMALTAVTVVMVVLAAVVAFYTMRLKQERDRAQREAATAEQVIAFMEGLFESSDPGEARGDTLTVREVMEAGAVRLRRELADQPAVRARLMDVIAGVYQNLRLDAEAEPLLREAVADWRTLGADGTLGLAESLNKLGRLYGQQMRQDDAVAAYEEALALRRAALGETHRDVGELLNNLSLIRIQQGNYAAAESLLYEALSMIDAPAGEPNGHAGAMYYNLAYVVQYRGAFEEAEALYRESLTRLRTEHGPDHPNVLYALQALSDVLADQGDLPAADSILQQVVAQTRRIHGATSVDYAFALIDQGRIRSEQRRFNEAIALQQDALAILRSSYPMPHPNLALGIEALGLAYNQAGRYGPAAEALRESLAMRRHLFHGVHPDVSNNLGNLGFVLRRSGDYAEAEALFREALAMDIELYGEAHREVATGLHNIAQIRLAVGDTVQAVVLHEQALAMRRQLFGAHHPHLAVSLTSLGLIRQAQGDRAGAERYLAEALAIRRALHDGDETHPAVRAARDRLDALRIP